jgi:hypothetical protein
VNPDWVPPQHGSVVANPDAKECLRITANHGILLRVGDEMVPLEDLIKEDDDEG